MAGAPDDDEDLAEIGADGALRPLGARAVSRLRARAGPYHVRPAPAHLVVLEHAADATSGGRAPRACLLSGEIRSAGALCDVLSFIGHVGYKGEFVVQDEESARSIYFDQGDVVGAQSNVVEERLGEVLYRYGQLTEAQVKACGDATTDGSLRFGEAAVKLGFVTREKLFGLMHHQTEEIFFAMMRVERGARFYFLEDFDETQLSWRAKTSVTTLIREGIRRMHEMRFFRARVPSERHVPARVGSAVATPKGEGDAAAFASRVWDAIDGARSIADVCRLVGSGEFEVTRAVFELLQAGRAVVKPPPMNAAEAVDIYNRAIALILRELDALDEGDAVRAQLAVFATASATHAELVGQLPMADDGTLDRSDIAKRVAAAENGRMRLAEWLYELASYALFLARPHLRRIEQTRAGKPRISVRVTALLEPISPKPGRRAGGVPPAAKATAKKVR